MAGNLKHAVTAGIHDGRARSQVFLAELLDDLGSGGGPIPQYLAADGLLERFNHLSGKPVWVDRKRCLQHHPGHLPMPCGRILPLGQHRHLPEATFRIAHPLDSGEVSDVAQPQRLEIRKSEPADRIGHMGQRVGSHVAVGDCIRQFPDSQAVQHDDRDAADHESTHKSSATRSREI